MTGGHRIDVTCCVIHNGPIRHSAPKTRDFLLAGAERLGAQKRPLNRERPRLRRSGSLPVHRPWLRHAIHHKSATVLGGVQDALATLGGCAVLDTASAR